MDPDYKDPFAPPSLSREDLYVSWDMETDKETSFDEREAIGVSRVSFRHHGGSKPLLLCVTSCKQGIFTFKLEGGEEVNLKFTMEKEQHAFFSTCVTALSCALDSQMNLMIGGEILGRWARMRSIKPVCVELIGKNPYGPSCVLGDAF